MKTNQLYFLIAFIALLSSCHAYKSIPYYQDIDRKGPSLEEVTNFSPLTIHPSDVLGISVTSRTPEASAIFNYTSKDYNTEFTGYLVDQKGNIQLPLIGKLKVEGLNIMELQDKVNQLLLTYFKDPVTNIRIINFKISVYGDVLKPDVYTIKDDRINLSQAIALAGDLNITAMRKNIILIREENGIRSYIPIDLTSKKIFSSPYYYLRSNDQIYVQPDKAKYSTVDRGYKTATLVLSGLSIIAIVLSNLYR